MIGHFSCCVGVISHHVCTIPGSIPPPPGPVRCSIRVFSSVAQQFRALGEDTSRSHIDPALIDTFRLHHEGIRCFCAGPPGEPSIRFPRPPDVRPHCPPSCFEHFGVHVSKRRGACVHNSLPVRLPLLFYDWYIILFGSLAIASQ